MNRVILIGRLSKDPESSFVGQNQTQKTTFSVAVTRSYGKDENGNSITDFLPCVAWGKTAQFISSYFRKGMRIGLQGSVQVRNYQNQQGVTVWVTEIIVDAAEFVENKTQTQAPAPAPAPELPPVMGVIKEAVAPPAPDISQAPHNVDIDDIMNDLPFEF